MTQQTKPETAIPDVTALSEFLTNLEQGDFARAAALELRKVVHSMTTAKDGGEAEPAAALTLTLNFKLTENGIVQVLGKIHGKHPTPPRKRSVFFATRDGDLSRRHPDQLDMMQDSTKKRLSVS